VNHEIHDINIKKQFLLRISHETTLSITFLTLLRTQ